MDGDIWMDGQISEDGWTDEEAIICFVCRHEWNFNVLQHNPNSILNCLGSISGELFQFSVSANCMSFI